MPTYQMERETLMNSREIVRRTIDRANPERLAFDYFAHGRHHTDIITSYLDREFDFDEQTWVKGGQEFRTDAFGNVWVRTVTDRATKGVIYWGALQDSWDGLNSFVMPRLSTAARNSRVKQLFDAHPNRFKVGCLGNASFSILAKLRGMVNVMQDLVLEPPMVHQACEIIEDELVQIVEAYAACGADGIHIMEDWGTQSGPLISPAMWRDFFAPGYRKICEAAHRHGMRVILHSCGMLFDLIEGFLTSGVDVLQFDQTDNYGRHGTGGIERLAAKCAGRATFFCPVDIQRTLVTGDRARIEDEVRKLLRHLAGRHGGFIAKSYGRGTKTYLDAIGCDPEWNDFAFECFVRYGREIFGDELEIPAL